MNAERLLAEYERIADAPDAIAKLRHFVLDLAVRGKLVPQESSDEPACALLRKIQRAKEQLSQRGSVKRTNESKPLDENEVPFTLPKAWRWVRVGDIFDYDAGVKREPKELDAARWLLELEDIEKDSSRIVARLRVRDRDSLSTKSEFEIDDILYGKLRPYLNKVVVADEPGYSTTEIVAIRPFFRLCPKYCALAFRRPDFVAYVERLGRGTKMPRLRTPDAIVAPFPLPPLAEQHRIVAKVDELMALCDQLEKARAERETIRDRLTAATLARLNEAGSAKLGSETEFALNVLSAVTTRRDHITGLRRTILTLAVEGRLVPQERSDEPAAALIEKIAIAKARRVKLGELKRSKEQEPREDLLPNSVPVGWELSCLGAVYDVRDGTHDTPKYVTNGVPLVTSKNLSSGQLSFENVKLISEADHRLISERSKVEEGDVLFAMIGSIGNPVTVNTSRPFSIKNVALFKHYDKSLTDTRYLRLFLEHAAIRMKAVATGGLQPFVSLGFLRSYPIALPPLAEQHRIVAKVDELMVICDQLEASLAKGEETRSKLLDALLHEALETGANDLETAA